MNFKSITSCHALKNSIITIVVSKELDSILDATYVVLRHPIQHSPF